MSCPGGNCPVRNNGAAAPAAAAPPTQSAVVVIDEYKYTPLKRAVLMGTFIGLAAWAFKCPCPEIFTCDRNIIITILGAVFLYVFVSTEPKNKG